MSIADRLQMSPQLRLAVQLTSTPSSALPSIVDAWCAERPDALEPLPPGASDPGDAEELELADDDRAPLPFLDESPLVDRGADVWVFGNPPQVRANGRAFPRLVATGRGTPDHAREAKWLPRALRMRARVYETVIRALLERRPQLALARDPGELAPLSVDELADSASLHAGTIERVATAVTLQNLHDVFGLVQTKSTLQLRRVER